VVVAEIVHGGVPWDADQITDVAAITKVAACIGMSFVTFTIKFALIAYLKIFASRDVSRALAWKRFLILPKYRRQIRQILFMMMLPGLWSMLIIGII
jgi:hypothetical protein